MTFENVEKWLNMKTIENIVSDGEIAHDEQFLP